MITIIGTGHVFDLAEPVAFIVQHTWPDAVLVELDMSRFNYLTGKDGTGGSSSGKVPPVYRQASEYQDRMSKQYGNKTGGEFLAAINMGKLRGADIVPIDTDALRVMGEMWDEMSFSEKTRYRLSGIRDRFGGKKSVESAQSRFAGDEERYMEEMRRRYPTLVRKLIDERNIYMAEQINSASEKYSNMVVVVGDGHVEGICALLKDPSVRKIRLADLLDRERLDKVRSMVYKGETENESRSDRLHSERGRALRRCGEVVLFLQILLRAYGEHQPRGNAGEDSRNGSSFRHRACGLHVLGLGSVQGPYASAR